MDTVDDGLHHGRRQELERRLIPVVDVGRPGQRPTPKRSVPALRPPDHDVPGEHSVVGYTDGFAQQRFAPVRRPTGHAGPQTLSARGE